MGRLKKFREASEVVSFRIPKIADSEERQFFKNHIAWFIEQFAWIRYSMSLKDKETQYITKEQYNKISNGNITKCRESFTSLIGEIIEYYKIPVS